MRAMRAARSQQQSFALAVALGFGLACLASGMPQGPQQDGPHTLLDIETPNQFTYNSPLAQPDSLKSKPYFDFLSTLYAHDAAKMDLFRNRPRRELDADADAAAPAAEADQPKSRRRDRRRRAIVFRPLFVYQQREIKKKEIAARRRSDEAQRRADYYYNRRV